MASREIHAAGAVIFRSGPDVLVVHRPKYDDWSFPKGKLDPGEPTTAAAVREVEEETGLRVRLGRPLPTQRYPVNDVPKRVDYWIGRVIGDDDVRSYAANAEIDQVKWMSARKASRRLTYPFDRESLEAAMKARKDTVPLVIVRHAEARSRHSWHADDRKRPLVVSGRRQAVTLSSVLAAYGIRRIVSSSSERCVQSVMPYADDAWIALEQTDDLAEGTAVRSTVKEVTAAAVDGLASHGGTVLCSHRPVLPGIFAGLGLDDPKLPKGGVFVAHLRKGKVVATEQHDIV